MNGAINGFPFTGRGKMMFFDSKNHKYSRKKADRAGVVRFAAVSCALCAVVATVVLLLGVLTEAENDSSRIVSGVNNNAAAYRANKTAYSAADFEVVTAKITVDSVSAADCDADNVIAVGKITGSGGEDIESEQAIKGTSVASYTVSAPVTVPVSGRLTSPFGYRTNPVSGKYGFHTGIDLAAAEGTPVAAAYGGVVTDSGESDVWGRYVLIEHSDGFETYYCHLSEIYAPEGTVLRKGETLGLVGSTGWSTGPHLHFEVRIDGVRVDPEPLIYSDEN